MPVGKLSKSKESYLNARKVRGPCSLIGEEKYGKQ